MAPMTSLADRLRSGEPAFAAWCGLPEPSIAGLLAREGFDAIVLDMQHGLMEIATIAQAIPLVTAAGRPALVRVPVGDFASASRALDCGAAGIIAPMINTVEDARLFAAATKFPPVGERSWGPHGALVLSGLSPDAYFAQANGFSVSLAMIETREALDLIDPILAVEGIDGVFIGPADLSIGLSRGAGLDPMGRAVDEAIKTVVKACRSADKHAAAFGHTPERSRDLARMGFGLVAATIDSVALRAGARQALEIARG